MLTAVVTRGLTIEVNLVAADDGDGKTEKMSFEESQEFCEFPYETKEEYEANAEAAHPCQPGPSPLAVEPKEFLWGAGAFLVLVLLMRVWLYPALKRGIDARYAIVRSGHEDADTLRASARADVAEYESQLATVKAEAAERIEAARQTLEAERSERMSVVDAEIAAKREAAAAEAAAQRAAVAGEVSSAAADVASRTIELATGRSPDADTVRRVVDDLASVEVGS